jgi:hypothetical protein
MDKIRKDWGLTHEDGPILSFSAAIKEPWCKYKTIHTLSRFLSGAGYPQWLLERQLVSRKGYGFASERVKEKQLKKDAVRKMESRGNQGSEPNKRNRSRTKSPNSRTF